VARPVFGAHLQEVHEVLDFGDLLRRQAPYLVDEALVGHGGSPRTDLVAHTGTRQPAAGPAGRVTSTISGPCLRPSRPGEEPHQLFRAAPPTRQVGQTGRGTGRAKALKLPEPIRAYQSHDRLAAAGDHDRVTGFRMHSVNVALAFAADSVVATRSTSDGVELSPRGDGLDHPQTTAA
jgi:hypothetical protein